MTELQDWMEDGDPGDADWSRLYALFKPLPGARQIFDLAIDHVQTSCGMGVPLYDYKDQRGQLEPWEMPSSLAGVEPGALPVAARTADLMAACHSAAKALRLEGTPIQPSIGEISTCLGSPPSS